MSKTVIVKSEKNSQTPLSPHLRSDVLLLVDHSSSHREFAILISLIPIIVKWRRSEGKRVRLRGKRKRKGGKKKRRKLKGGGSLTKKKRKRKKIALSISRGRNYFQLEDKRPEAFPLSARVE